jgi:AraC-like DNA-binding protein
MRQRVGYRNPYAFATAFRRVTGASPGAERRRLDKARQEPA